MILRNDEQLKENLFELKDHKVIRETKEGNKKTIFYMNYDQKILTKIINDDLDIEHQT